MTGTPKIAHKTCPNGSQVHGSSAGWRKMLHNSHKDGTNHAGFHNNKDTHHCNAVTAVPPAV